MAEPRKGRQTPTKSVVLPYTESYGQEAIDLYNSTGRTAQEWQEIQMFDILAVNDEGLWVHTKYGYAVPRRNGKNEIVAMREIYGLIHGEKILHTAHRTTTSASASRRLAALLDAAGYTEIIRAKKEKNTINITPTPNKWASSALNYWERAAGPVIFARDHPKAAWAKDLTSW